MKRKSLSIVLCFIVIFIFAGCSSGYTFSYDNTQIKSITIYTIQAGNNKENIIVKKDWDKLIEDMNGLKYKSYSGQINEISKYQIVIKFKNGDDEIIDANRIRRLENKPQKYKCDEAEFDKVVEKYIK